MKWTEWLKMIVLAGGIIGGTWAFADAYGFRPALKVELDRVVGDVTTVAVSVDWLRLENYERRLARGQTLTRQECADYRRLAQRLNVPARPC